MILLDTHVIAWFWSDDRRLGQQAKQEISLALEQNIAAVSAISFWEVGMRLQKGQIDVGLPLDAWRNALLEEGIIEIPVDGGIAMRAGLLEDIHGDPADRIIVATALEGHQLVTADGRILNWPGPLARMNADE